MLHSCYLYLSVIMFFKILLNYFQMRKRRKERELEVFLQLFLIEVEALHQSHMQVLSFTFICNRMRLISNVICCRKCVEAVIQYELVDGMFSVIILEKTKLFLIISILFCYCLSGISLFFFLEDDDSVTSFLSGKLFKYTYLLKIQTTQKAKHSYTLRSIFLCVWVRQEE